MVERRRMCRAGFARTRRAFWCKLRQRQRKALGLMQESTNLLLTVHLPASSTEPAWSTSETQRQAPARLLSEIPAPNAVSRGFCARSRLRSIAFQDSLSVHPRAGNLQTEFGKIRWRLKETRPEYGCNKYTENATFLAVFYLKAAPIHGKRDRLL